MCGGKTQDVIETSQRLENVLFLDRTQKPLLYHPEIKIENMDVAYTDKRIS